MSDHILFDRPTDIDGIMDFFFMYPSELIGDIFGLTIIGSLFLLVFISTMEQGVNRAFAAGSFTAWILSIFASVFGIVGGEVFVLTTIATITAVIINKPGPSI